MMSDSVSDRDEPEVLDPASTPVRRNPSVSAHRRLIAQMKAEQDGTDTPSSHRDEETGELFRSLAG